MPQGTPGPAQLDDRLIAFERHSRELLEFRPDLPKTMVGKVLRRALRES